MIGQLFYIMREETKQKIFIIGCGGTGSNYIKELARYLATNRNYMINADVILIDGDTVEEKNLERQSFTPEDLLMNKVVVGIKNNQAVIAPDRAFYFPEVLEDSKSVLEMSCTELNNVKPQHLVTNLFAANICLIQTIKILSGDWTCGGIYSFDAFGCSCTRTDPNLIKQQQKGKLK